MATKTKSKAVVVQEKIDLLAPKLSDIVPPNVDAARYLRIAKLFVSKDSKLNECSPVTVASAIMDAAALGLEIGREAHLVPFKGHCQMLPDYRGYQKLAIQSGLVRVIEANVVYEGDEFDYAEGTEPYIKHKPDLKADRGDGNVIAFYCVAHLKDGTTTFIVRTPAQIEHIRDKSRSKDRGPWKDDWQAMGRKTVIKELCDKRIPWLDERLAAVVELDNRFETGEIKRPLLTDNEDAVAAHMAAKTRERLNELKGEEEIEDGEAEDITDQRAREEDAELAGK